MAETTTTTLSPLSRLAATFSATAAMRSGEPTDVPPYFCTINAIKADKRLKVKDTSTRQIRFIP
jgi:hypothetical protein